MKAKKYRYTLLKTSSTTWVSLNLFSTNDCFNSLWNSSQNAKLTLIYWNVKFSEKIFSSLKFVIIEWSISSVWKYLAKFF